MFHVSSCMLNSFLSGPETVSGPERVKHAVSGPERNGLSMHDDTWNNTTYLNPYALCTHATDASESSDLILWMPR